LQEESKRLSKARELILCGDIEAEDYRIMKSEIETRITRLEVKLTGSITDSQNIEPLWDKAISNIFQLDSLYENGNTIQKRKIIGSVFPEKLTFDGSQFRTTKINEALEYILLIDNKIGSKKNGTNPSFLDLSREVTPAGQNSNHLIEDLMTQISHPFLSTTMCLFLPLTFLLPSIPVNVRLLALRTLWLSIIPSVGFAP